MSPLSKTGLLLQWLFTLCSVSPLSKTGLFLCPHSVFFTSSGCSRNVLCHLSLKLDFFPVAIHTVFYSPLSKIRLFPVAIHAVFYSPLSKIRLFSSGYSRCVLCRRSLKLDSCYVHTVFSSPLSKSGLLLQWLFTLSSIHLCLRLDFFPVAVSPLSKTALLPCFSVTSL